MPGNVKGALLVHFSRYVTENGGDARYRALVDKLSPEQHHPCRFDARGGVCTYDVSW